MWAGHRTASPAATRVRSSSTPTQPPPSITMNQEVFGLECGSIAAPRANAISLIAPRASEWMSWPVTPVVPGGPSARRWPTPNRRTSIGIELAAAAALAPRHPAASDPALRVGDLLLRVVALAGEPLLV